MEKKEVMIDGVKYVRSDLVSKPAKFDGMKYVVVRADRAGVFAGYMESEEGSTVVLRYARHIWYWDGASSTAELAMKGVSKPENCKFPAPIGRVKILGVIEIIEATEEARDNITGVWIWTQH